MGSVATVEPQGSIASPGSVLHRVALTVSSSLDIKEVLERLARLTLEAIPADRCNLFLIDEGGTRLLPALSIGEVSDPGLWERFRGLEPIDMLAVPDRWKAFTGGRALFIADMAASPLIPPQIVEAFRSRAAFLAPLIANGEPIGVLSVDWMSEHVARGDDELALLEAIAGYAALAIRNARLYQGLAAKARSLERLVEVAGRLHSAPTLHDVPELVCAAFEDLLATTHCSVNLAQGNSLEGARSVVVRGAPWFTDDPERVAAIGDAELRRIRDRFTERPEPILYRHAHDGRLVDPALVPKTVRSVAIFPLAQPGGLLGAVVAGFDDDYGPSREMLGIGQALADLAAAAIGRGQVDERLRQRVQQLEVLYRLSDVAAGTAELAGAIRDVNRALPAELGLRIRSIAVANARERDTVGARAPDSEEMEAIRSWRATVAAHRPPAPRPVPGGLLVPVAHRRVHGVLRVDVRDGVTPDQALLMAIGTACAEVLGRAGLFRQLAERDRRLTIAAERERIAQDLHDSVGQLLIGMGMRLAQYATEIHDPTWSRRLEELMQLASEGSRDVRQAIASLLFLEVRRSGLVASLRDLANRFETSSGIATPVRVTGTPRTLPVAVCEALFRVAHESLMNVQRHSRASVAAVSLAFEPDRVVLTVRDDGVGMGQRDPFGAGRGHFGFVGVRRRMQEVGGELKVSNGQPRGVAVTATVMTTETTGRDRRHAADARRHR